MRVLIVERLAIDVEGSFESLANKYFARCLLPPRLLGDLITHECWIEERAGRSVNPYEGSRCSVGAIFGFHNR